MTVELSNAEILGLIVSAAGAVGAFWLTLFMWGRKQHESLRSDMTDLAKNVYGRIHDVEVVAQDKLDICAAGVRAELNTKADKEDFKRCLHLLDELQKSTDATRDTIVSILRDK